MDKPLYISKNTKDILKRYNFSMTKGLGQNFLIDGQMIEKICQASNLSKNDSILEIGPGIGTLSQCLCERSRFVLAVEIDQELATIHHETLHYENFKLIYEDFLKLNLQNLFNTYLKEPPIKVIANIPYYITTPIIMKLLEESLPIDTITVMVQKEVAERLTASPGSKNYGAISAVIAYHTQAEIVFTVPKSVFLPQPKVDSAVIVMTRHKTPPVTLESEELFFKLIKGSFGQRRKTMINSVSGTIPSIKKDTLKSVLEKLGYNPALRGETLGIEDFAIISNALHHHTKLNP
jgi:16S rRNA (adenine1518-N6/adenine1519-N6)-dimethyltransferase